jgi:hypothetical protein
VRLTRDQLGAAVVLAVPEFVTDSVEPRFLLAGNHPVAEPGALPEHFLLCLPGIDLPSDSPRIKRTVIQGIRPSARYLDYAYFLMFCTYYKLKGMKKRPKAYRNNRGLSRALASAGPLVQLTQAGSARCLLTETVSGS